MSQNVEECGKGTALMSVPNRVSSTVPMYPSRAATGIMSPLFG